MLGTLCVALAIFGTDPLASNYSVSLVICECWSVVNKAVGQLSVIETCMFSAMCQSAMTGSNPVLPLLNHATYVCVTGRIDQSWMDLCDARIEIRPSVCGTLLVLRIEF